MKLVLVIAALIATGCAPSRVQPVVNVPPPDSLLQEVLRLEQALLARDDTIRALRLELRKLKEIDLKPRQPGGDRSKGTGVSGG